MANPLHNPAGCVRSNVTLALLVTVMVVGSCTSHQQDTMLEQGHYFQKKSYDPKPLPTWESLQSTLPVPIYDAEPGWIDMYWKAWEIASRNFYEPAPGSGYVSQFTDAAFNDNIFLWDTAFITMFATLAEPLVPGIESLDNFYAKQHGTGEISREINRMTGEDYVEWINHENQPLFSRWGWNAFWRDAEKEKMAVQYVGREAPEPNPKLTLDALNHPILAWAELESFHQTGDTERLALVYPPLVRYYEALDHYLRQGNGLFITDWASMDNATRNPLLVNGGVGIDISAEMVLFKRNLAEMALVLGRETEARAHEETAASISEVINEKMWLESERFYFDLTLKGEPVIIRSVAAFWALIAGVADGSKAQALVAELQNKETFGRIHQVPTLSAAEPGYESTGGYWCGAVWAPTNTMVIRGLERYGYSELAADIAMNHLKNVGQVFQSTRTLWENYAPDEAIPGQPSRPDFVGWSGIAPIRYLLEYAIGLKANAPENKLIWKLSASGRHGCKRYLFGGHTTSLEATPGRDGKMRIEVESDGEYTLEVVVAGMVETFDIQPGVQVLERTSFLAPESNGR